MKCALWLNRRRVFSAEEIPASFDLASLRGYFLAGSLIPWLCDNGGAAFAEKLRGLSADAPALNERLTEVFCGVLPEPCRPQPAPTAPFTGEAERAEGAQGPCSFGGSQGAGALGSYGVPGSFWQSAASYRGFGSLTWESLQALGSWHTATSYKGFGSMTWERLERAFGGSWSAAAFGSFGALGGSWSAAAFGSFGALGGSWSAATSYKGFGSMAGSGAFGGSFTLERFLANWERVLRWEQPRGSFTMLAEDEYDRILLLTLAKCPLDRFGYGIHVLYD